MTTRGGCDARSAGETHSAIHTNVVCPSACLNGKMKVLWEFHVSGLPLGLSVGGGLGQGCSQRAARVRRGGLGGDVRVNSQLFSHTAPSSEALGLLTNCAALALHPVRCEPAAYRMPFSSRIMACPSMSGCLVRGQGVRVGCKGVFRGAFFGRVWLRGGGARCLHQRRKCQ
jgi:hypothetical protein